MRIMLNAHPELVAKLREVPWLAAARNPKMFAAVYGKSLEVLGASALKERGLLAQYLGTLGRKAPDYGILLPDGKIIISDLTTMAQLESHLNRTYFLETEEYIIFVHQGPRPAWP
jgi:hypothetical protein